MSEPIYEDKGRDNPAATAAPEPAVATPTSEPEPQRKISLLALYRYATPRQRLAAVGGALLAMASGAMLPLIAVVLGSLASTLQDIVSGASREGELGQRTAYLVYLALGQFFLTAGATLVFSWTGVGVADGVRERYMAAVLRQDTPFFDGHGTAALAAHMANDIPLIQEAVSEKAALALASSAAFVAGLLIAFLWYWKLALVTLSGVAATAVVTAGGNRVISAWKSRYMAHAGEAERVIDETLGSMVDVKAYNAEDHLTASYTGHLRAGMRWNIRARTGLGLVIGLVVGISYWNIGLGLWFGGKMLAAGDTSVSAILAIVMAVIIGASAIGNIGPYFEVLASALPAAARVYAVIDREPEQQDDTQEQPPVLPSGNTSMISRPGTSTSFLLGPRDSTVKMQNILRNPQAVHGRIDLRGVRHAYPSRPDTVILDNVDMVFPAGKTTALVGAPGSGKLSIFGLLQRLYNPLEGQIQLDGQDLPALPRPWLRSITAYVPQEPVLFSETITENILRGLSGTSYDEEPRYMKISRMRDACRMACAHEFIEELEHGYETVIDPTMLNLSPGQKQRLAIARAIIRNPRILLLDEAMSALDTRSEAAVHRNMTPFNGARTVIMVPRRISTIRHVVDNVIVMKAGKVVETGTFAGLENSNGHFATLLRHEKSQEAGCGPPVLRRRSTLHRPVRPPSSVYSRPSSRHNSMLSEIMTPTFNADARDETYGIMEAFEDGFFLSPLDPVQIREPPNPPAATEASADKVPIRHLFRFLLDPPRRVGSHLLLGLLASFGVGCAQPVQAYLFAKVIVVLFNTPVEVSSVSHWALMYLVLGLCTVLVYAVQGIFLARTEEQGCLNARSAAASHIVRQPLDFFMNGRHSVGYLTSFLSADLAHMCALIGPSMGAVVSALTTVVACFIVGLVVGWKLALACVAVVLAMIGTGLLRVKVIARASKALRESYEKSNLVARESINAATTVQSYCMEETTQGQLTELLKTGRKGLVKPHIINSCLYAVGQCPLFLAIALCFWYGGKLVQSGEYSLFQLFFVFSALILGIQSTISTFSHVDILAKAVHTGQKLLGLLDLDWETQEAEGPDATESTKDGGEAALKGRVDFHDVAFSYPHASNPTLKGITLSAEPGKMIALVGEPGSGKSTIIRLLERLFEPQQGSISIGGRDIRSMPLEEYRRGLALIHQEPRLYSGTIRENLVLGLTQSQRDALARDDLPLVRACMDASIYEFIIGLPNGWDTVVGPKTEHLSGGQRQRLAIARALLRDPRILLLDEATSGLDPESEGLVKEALARAQKGRVTIVVAQRLKTIEEADCIYFVENGRVAERGRHADLVRVRSGKYRELLRMQES